ncbi:MAG: PspA/IM30 family protein [Desulfitobacteriaceae bacterium]|nr:PspA/IM30 family protein [Desulfitobacteriaceae bacterium]MDI6913515.1 PspA/IM30 family protein [Desulfitobacteriaceae bacterium]
MSVLSRLKDIFGAKVEKGLNGLENPKEMLDYSLVKMEEGLQALARNIAEFGTAKKRLEFQRSAFEETIRRYDEQAQKALELGQEDLAKEALGRKLETQSRLADVNSKIEQMNAQLDGLAKSQEDLRQKIQNFRIKKEELKALYTASQAQLKVKELLTSAGSEAENIGRTVERAEARIQEMQARAGALDDLVDKGLLTEVLSNGQDDIERKLNRLSSNATVEAELAKLKERVAG